MIRARLTSTTAALLAFSLLGPLTTACGGGGSPTAPTPVAPVPSLQLTTSPSPVVAQVVSTRQGITTYRVFVSVTLREQAGTGGRITRLRSTVVRSTGGETAGALDVDAPFQAFGSVTQEFSQDFELNAAAAVSLRISASGIDGQGRSFDTGSVVVGVEPPSVTPPFQNSTRVDMYGGANGRVYLGCVTCNRFDSDSIYNQFGNYGSRFSSTSIWNQFSDYGSPFNTYSACNAFATNPPIWLVGNQVLGELTLNQFRTNRIRDAAVLAWLRDSVCPQ